MVLRIKEPRGRMAGRGRGVPPDPCFPCPARPPRWSTSSHSSQSEMWSLSARPATTSTKFATLRACGDASVTGSVLAFESRVLESDPGRELPF